MPAPPAQWNTKSIPSGLVPRAQWNATCPVEAIIPLRSLFLQGKEEQLYWGEMLHPCLSADRYFTVCN